MKKSSVSFVALIFIALGSLEAVQVIEGKKPNMGGAFGKGFADGFNRGIERGMADAERSQEEESCNQLIEEFITNYDPSKHSRCISVILRSQLSTEMKELVIAHLNTVYEEYLKKK